MKTRAELRLAKRGSPDKTAEQTAGVTIGSTKKAAPQVRGAAR
jgi:hypothetical protein